MASPSPIDEQRRIDTTVHRQLVGASAREAAAQRCTVFEIDAQLLLLQAAKKSMARYPAKVALRLLTGRLADAAALRRLGIAGRH